MATARAGGLEHGPHPQSRPVMRAIERTTNVNAVIDRPRADGPAWARAADALALAGRVVAAHGMPARHAAARQQLAGLLGVYDRFFGMGPTWQLGSSAAPGAPLTWLNGRGDIVIDIARTAPP